MDISDGKEGSKIPVVLPRSRLVSLRFRISIRCCQSLVFDSANSDLQMLVSDGPVYKIRAYTSTSMSNVELMSLVGNKHPTIDFGTRNNTEMYFFIPSTPVII